MFMRKVAIIDLNAREVKTEEIPIELLKDEIGGASLNLYFYKKFSQYEPIVVGTGPLTGTLVPASASAVVTARSPITGALVHIPITWHIGTEIKYSGFDLVLIMGSSKAPIYIWCHDEIAEICDGDKFQKMNTADLVESLRTELGDESIQIIGVGPAGRRGFKAGMISENYWGSKDSEGIGTAFGEKNIIACAFRGLGSFKTSEGFVNECLTLRNEIDKKNSPEPNIIKIFQQLGSKQELLKILETHLHRNNSCFNCGYNCYGYFKFRESAGILKKTEIPAPGTMITSPFSAKLLFDKAEDKIFEALEECLMQGAEPGAVSILLEKATKQDIEKILERNWDKDAGEKIHSGFKKIIDESGFIYIPFIPASLSFLKKNADLREFLTMYSLSVISGICPIFAINQWRPDTKTLEGLIKKSMSIDEINLELKVNNFIRENIALTKEMIDKRILDELKEFL